jgi:GH25 family lysozyme M1 (1,4-beta-N-acetylmuramidase)
VIFRSINPVDGVASAQGIDASNYQGNLDWVTAKRQVPNLAFGFFRLTEGLPASRDNSPDPFAAHNRHSLSDAGLVQGAYHFLHPSLSGRAQARYFVEEYGKLGLFQPDMLALDSEATDGLGSGAIAACALDFMEELTVLCPHNPKLVYSNLAFARMDADHGLERWPLWLAYPSVSAPPAPAPWSSWRIWQWGVRRAGGETVDADAFNGSMTDFRNWLAGYNPQPSGPYKHTTDGTKTLKGLAATRGERPGPFLNQQFALGGSGVEDALASEVVPAGLTYLTHNP